MRSEALRGYSLLSPTMVLMIIALAAPLLMLITMSFWTQDYLDFNKGFYLDNYESFFEKKKYWFLLLKSMRISATVTLATVLLAYPMAYFIAFRVQKNKLVWLILITVPFWTSYLLRVFAWKVVLGYNGVINSGLMTLGFIDAPLEFLLYNETSVIITLAHAWAAFAILPIYVSLEKIDRSLLEAAQDLGEGPFMTFLRVTLPLSIPGVVAASLLVYIPTVGDYVTPTLVGGPRGIMIGNIIQSQFGKALNWAHGCGPFHYDYAGRHRGGMSVCLAHQSIQERWDMRAGTGKLLSFDGFAIYAVIYLIFIYLPVLFLPLFSFNDSIYVAFPLKGFTFEWYERMFNNPSLISAFFNSVKVASSVAVLSTVLGMLAAKAVTRYRMPGRGPIVGFIMVPLVIPEIIMGIALLVLIYAGENSLEPLHHRDQPSIAVCAVLDAGFGVSSRRFRQKHGRGGDGFGGKSLVDLLASNISPGRSPVLSPVYC